jgi:hypothetical protein
MRAIAVALVVLIAFTTHARAAWPPEDCKAARGDIDDLAKKASDAETKAADLAKRLASAKGSQPWKDAIDGLATGGLMTLKALKSAYTISTSLLARLALAKDLVKDPLAAVEKALGVDETEALKKRLADRAAGIKILDAASTSARTAAKALRDSVTDANTALATYCH